MKEKSLNSVKRWLNYVWDAINLNNTDFFNGDHNKEKKFRRELAILALSVIHKESRGKQDLLNKKTKDKKIAAFGLTQQKPKFFSKLWGSDKYDPKQHILIYINTMIGFYKKNGSLLTSAFCWASGEKAVEKWIINDKEAIKEYPYLLNHVYYMKDLFNNIYPLYFDFVLTWLEDGRPVFEELIISENKVGDNFKLDYKCILADYSINVDLFSFFSPWKDAAGVFVWRGVGMRAIGDVETRPAPGRSVWRGAAFLILPITGIIYYKWMQKIK